MRLHCLVKLEIIVFVKIIMLEKAKLENTVCRVLFPCFRLSVHVNRLPGKTCLQKVLLVREISMHVYEIIIIK